VKEAIVTDSTCLIGLERINLLAILPQLFEPVIVPSAVANEFGGSFEWLIVEVPTDESLLTSLRLQIDLGEAETIALAYERASRVLLDDRQARTAARKLGLRIIGTVGMLVRAKRESIIPDLTAVLDQLEANNFYMSNDLRNEAVRLVGE
jgi:predicted nucleic acid-binding protein